ncbi:MAG: hypothetical protein VX494_03455 [Actinomycetota bacterium]|nr:hypothetical protein [Actinomycetota bacterium]
MSGRRTTSTRPAVRIGAGLAAAAMVSLALPVTTGSAAPAAPSAAAPTVRTADPEFAGYAATTTATPVRVEIYEPTIPIPASPQAELNLGYSIVKADSSTSRGRASYFWPGDAVGEGFKTIVENLGLPPELAGPIAEQGYPVQVNSNHPAGPASESSEDFPGSISRTSASAEKTTALAGYSTDCRLGQPDAAPADEGGEGGGDEGPIPGLPGLPDLPFPAIPGLGEALSSTVDQTVTTLTGGALSTTGQQGSKRGAKAAEEEVECPIPAQLAAVIDLGGVGASSTVTRGTDDDGVERVKAVSRSVVGEVSLLGGIITLDGLVSTARTTSDGAKATVKGVTDYGTLTIAGQKFRYGSDGFEAAGTPQDLPGLPADPNQALEALGIQLLLPQPTEEREGDKGTVAVGGLQVVIDAGVLRTQLVNGGLPIDAIAEAIAGLPLPEEAGQLKSLLGAALNLSPKFVITLGNASAVVDTSPEIEIPDFNPDETDNNPTSPVDTGSGAGGTGGDLGGGDLPASDPAPAGGGEPAIGETGTLTDAGPVGAGLPELFSIPGALFFGGILGATVLGSYLRRLGLLALGGGVSCAHGLESGLPDLRKA